MITKTLTADRVSLPPGFRMFILPEYRLVTPTYSVKLSRAQGTILSALLANYESYVLRSDIVNGLWGHLEDGGPETADNTVSVTLFQMKAKFSLIGIHLVVKGRRWTKNDRALKASGLRECKHVGRSDNAVRLKALRDKQSPNPARGLPKPSQADPFPLPPPPPPPPTRYSHVQRPRLQVPWTHNARAEAYFGKGEPT